MVFFVRDLFKNNIISTVFDQWSPVYPDLENVTIHTIRDGVKLVWVKLVTEHTVFCPKFNLLSQFCISLGKKF